MTQSDRVLERLSFPIQYLEIGESMLRARGLDVAGLYKLCGVAYSPNMPPGQTINGVQMRTAMQLFLNVCEPKPAPLIQIIQHFPLSIHGPLGVMAMTSATLGEALDSAVEYAPLIMPAFTIRRENHGKSVHLVFERRYDFGRVNEIFTETVLGTFLNIRPFLTEEPFPVQVHFTHAPLAEEAEYDLGPDAQFLFNASRNQLVFNARNLSIPMLAPSRGARQLMQATLEQQRLTQAEAQPAALQVRRLLQQALQEGRPMDAEQVAAGLKVSGRTLSRRLQAEGSTLPQLQAEVGVEFAKLLLLESEKSIAEIASSVGFQDATSFARAFKRVMGLSPSQFRDAVPGEK